LIKSGPTEKEFINNTVKEFEGIIKEFKEWGTLELTGFCKHLASRNERYIAAEERRGKWNFKDI